MQSVRLLLPVLLVGAVMVGAACGGGESKKPAAADSGETPVVATGTPVSDEEYLRVFCTGATKYQEAVNTSSTAEGITRAIKQYVADLQKTVPPADISGFHAAYIKYLQAAEPDPTSLLTTKPPVPPDGPRGRLADKTASVSECKYPTFLNPPKS